MGNSLQQALASGQISQAQFNQYEQLLAGSTQGTGATPAPFGQGVINNLNNQAGSGTPGTPGNLQSYTGQYPASVISAAQQIFNSDPSQQATFQNTYGGDLTAWLGSFTQWWSNNGSSVANNMAQYGPEANLLSALGYTQGGNGNFVAGPNAIVQPPPVTGGAAGSTGPATTNQPVEQGLYNETINQLNNEVLNDQNLATDTQALQNSNIAGYNQLGQVLQQAVAPPGGLSQVTVQEQAAATTAATTQLNALAQSVSSMQSSLSGTLAQQAAALQQAIQQQQSNIATYGDTASQALTQQINQQLSDLQNSIGQQQSALQTQIQQLSGAADASSQAQLATLQTQLQQLNSAEAPVAQARNAAAQMQVTAVNIGEAQAKNQIEAQQQLQGFVGGSTELDNALVQAGIGAQQQGATAVGNAALENAQDYQGIANQGANTQANIGNTLATQQQAITGQGATGQAQLAGALATGTQALQDTGAAGQAGITNTVAQQQEQTANTGAQQQYANTAAGLAQQNQLNNALAQGQYGITSTQAQQQQTDLNNQFGQSLAAALAQAALPGQEASSIAATDNLQNAGLLNAQNALNWWATNSAAPTPTTTNQTASTAGNTIAAAGSGLLNAATSIGNANNWWQTPASTTSATSPFVTLNAANATPTSFVPSTNANLAAGTATG